MVFNTATYILCTTIFQLWKPEDPEKTTDLSQVADKLYHIMLYTSLWSRFEFTTSVVRGTNHCIGSWKSNYHTITATTTPVWIGKSVAIISKNTVGRFWILFIFNLMSAYTVPTQWTFLLIDLVHLSCLMWIVSINDFVGWSLKEHFSATLV